MPTTIDVSHRRVRRVEIEFEDGEVQVLTGTDANEYQKSVISNATVAYCHGMQSPTLAWQQLKPPRP